MDYKLINALVPYPDSQNTYLLPLKETIMKTTLLQPKVTPFLVVKNGKQLAAVKTLRAACKEAKRVHANVVTGKGSMIASYK